MRPTPSKTLFLLLTSLACASGCDKSQPLSLTPLPEAPQMREATKTERANPDSTSSSEPDPTEARMKEGSQKQPVAVSKTISNVKEKPLGNTQVLAKDEEQVELAKKSVIHPGVSGRKVTGGTDTIGARTKSPSRGIGLSGSGGRKRRSRELGLSGMGTGGGGIGHGAIHFGLSGTGRGGSASGAGIGSSGYGVSAREREQVADTSAARVVPRSGELILTLEEPISTFGADVDTASYTLARGVLQSGGLPNPSDVRTEEFVNAFDYDYPAPPQGQAFGIHVEAAPSPFDAKGTRTMVRIGIQGEPLTAQNRQPRHLTFLVDVSGSMQGTNRLELAKRSMKFVVGTLKDKDTMAIVTYASGSKVVLEPTPANQKRRIIQAIRSLRAQGSTAMSDGLDQAYTLAAQTQAPGHISRVLVLSDGDANVGIRDPLALLRQVKEHVERGITLSTIGFGMGNFKGDRMEQLANMGNGNAYYIDSVDEAKHAFVDKIDGMLQVIAKDVKIQVEFDPRAVTAYRLIGYENRAVANRDFRRDHVDAGEIGIGYTVTALYEVVMLKDAPPQSTLATVRVRHKAPSGTKASETEVTLHTHQVQPTLAVASHDFQFAVAVAGFAGKLRGTKEAQGLSYGLIHEIAQSGTGKTEGDRQAFLALIKRAESLDGRRSE